MRVLELLSSPNWTGPAEPMASVARELERRGHGVEVAVDTRRRGDLRERLTAMGFTMRMDLALSTKAGPWSFLHDVHRLREVAKGFDVIHAHFSNDHTLALMALPSRHPLRLVRTLHSARSLGVFRGWAHRRTDGLMTVCQRDADFLIRQRRVESQRVVAIHGAVDSEFFTPEGPDLRDELRIDRHVPVVGIVSRIKPDRGHGLLIDAFVKVVRQMPTARLVIVGRGEGLTSVRQYARRVGLEREVIFAGYRTGSELAAAYRTFDVKVLMAEGNDGTCRALLEAMACGRPGISFNFGAPGETIVDRETGRLIAGSGNVGRRRDDRLAQVILEVLTDRSRARAMGAAARKRMQTLYTEGARGQAVEAFLHRILGLPPVGSRCIQIAP